MGRTKTATNILEARGRFKKNPQRRNKKEPKVFEPLPAKAPAHLDEREAGCWAEIKKMVPRGVLTAAGALALAYAFGSEGVLLVELASDACVLLVLWC